MSLLPRVQNCCPYKGRFASVLHGSRCRLCKRRVADLTTLESDERDEVLGACTTEATLTYGIAARSFFAALTVGSLAFVTLAES